MSTIMQVMSEHGLVEQTRPAIDQIAEKLKQFSIMPPERRDTEGSTMTPLIEQSPRLMAREDTPTEMRQLQPLENANPPVTRPVSRPVQTRPFKSA
jgi:hypothetical protein